MEKLLSSRARGKSEKWGKKGETRIEDVIIESLCKSTTTLVPFMDYLKVNQDENKKKVERLNKLFSSGLAEPIAAGNKEALVDARQMADSFDINHQGEFQNEMYDEMLEAKKGAREVLGKGELVKSRIGMGEYLQGDPEIRKVQNLVRHVELYLKKSRHSSSESKIQRARYYLGQMTPKVKSVDESFQKVIDDLEGISVDGFERAIEVLAANKARMSVYEEAHDRISNKNNKKGVLAGKEFLEGLTMHDMGRFGIRPTLLQRAVRRNAAANAGASSTGRGTKNHAGATKEEAWVDKTWDYYTNLQKWAADSLDITRKQEIERLFANLDKDPESTDDSAGLIKLLDTIWLEKTKSISDKDRDALLKRMGRANTPDDILAAARACIAVYVSNDEVRDALVKHAGSKGPSAIREMEGYFDEIDRRITNNDFLPGENEEMWERLCELSRDAYKNKAFPTSRTEEDAAPPATATQPAPV